MTPPLDLARLSELAEKADAATPGPWRVDDDRYVLTGVDDYLTGPLRRDNAAFIAAFDPTTAKALLSEIARLRSALQGLVNQYTDDTAQMHDLCGESECAVARARTALSGAATEPAEREAARCSACGGDRMEPERQADVRRAKHPRAHRHADSRREANRPTPARSREGGRMSSEPLPPIDTIHGLGCRCWPHVSQKALAACQEAAIETARLEYLEGRKAVGVYRADLEAKVRALIEEAGGLCVAPADIEDPVCETHSELLMDGPEGEPLRFCEDDPRELRAVLRLLTDGAAE